MPVSEREPAVARLLDICPPGHEVVDRPDGVELAVYLGREKVRELRTAFPDATVEPVAPGWEDEWRRFHSGTRVGALWVGPPWEPAPADALAVVIDPGRAFGTGSHPTTRLCLGYLLELEPASLVDVGCGSGVLAIAAARLGFEPVSALDCDEAALDATRRNAAANGVSIAVRRADALVDDLPEAEVAVANIALEPIGALAGRLRAERLVTSGYLVADRPRLRGLAHVDRRELDGWAADLYSRE